MSELGTKKGGLRPAPAGISVGRAEFEKLLQLGNGQFECDNRQEALTCYRAAFELAPTARRLRALRAADGGVGERQNRRPCAAPVEIVFLCRRIGEVYQLRAEYEAARASSPRRSGGSMPIPTTRSSGKCSRSAARSPPTSGASRRPSACSSGPTSSSSIRPTIARSGRSSGGSESSICGWAGPQEARNYFESALATFRRIGDQRGIAGTLNNLGVIHKLACEWMEAIRVMEKGLLLNEIWPMRPRSGRSASTSASCT